MADPAAAAARAASAAAAPRAQARVRRRRPAWCIPAPAPDPRPCAHAALRSGPTPPRLRRDTLAGVINIAGMLFASTLFVGFTNSMTVQHTIDVQRRVFYR